MLPLYPSLERDNGEWEVRGTDKKNGEEKKETEIVNETERERDRDESDPGSGNMWEMIRKREEQEMSNCEDKIKKIYI